jgi:hypothetical protein
MDVRKLVTVVTGCPRDGRRRPHRWTDVDARLIIRIAFGQNSKPFAHEISLDCDRPG